MAYKIGFTELGRSSLKAFEKNVRREIMRKLLPLAGEPESGKPLIGPFLGLHSLRVRNRYRVVYRIDEVAEKIYVELVGERDPGQDNDVYRVARKLLDSLK